MSWTDARIETLRNAWEQGLTASQIAEALGEGISRNAVIGKAHRLGLKARPSPVKGAETSIVATLVESVAAPVVAAVSATVAAVVAAVSAPAPARAAPPAVRKPTAAAAKPSKTSLLDLSEKICKWPIGHPGDADFHFCGRPSNAGFPYCNDHCLQAYQAQLPRRDRNRAPPPVMPGFGPRR